ncbi:hypothetical protein HanIR_Chr15g0776511 [Helianthus annuus]|nr:hypothetical protein HanIR_Chr15g0776511 [Helianthus annuus]
MNILSGGPGALDIVSPMVATRTPSIINKTCCGLSGTGMSSGGIVRLDLTGGTKNTIFRRCNLRHEIWQELLWCW